MDIEFKRPNFNYCALDYSKALEDYKDALEDYCGKLEIMFDEACEDIADEFGKDQWYIKECIVKRVMNNYE